MGATICLRLLARHPDLVASLSAHEPPLFGLLAGDPTWEPALQDVQRRIRRVLELLAQDRTAQAAERFVEDVALGPGAWRQLPEEDRLIRHAPTFVEESADPSITELDLPSLADVTTPVLLTGGAASPPLYDPSSNACRRRFPRVTRHRFAEAATSRT